MSEVIVLRKIPVVAWTRLLWATLVAVMLGSMAWEVACRRQGYEAGLDDTSDLWAEARRTVRPDSTVMVGSSRGLFNFDLDALQEGLGTRPIQLCLVGSSPAPIMMNLAEDLSFHGTVILDLVPGMVPMPETAPPYQNALRAIRREKEQTWADWMGHQLSLPLERSLACLQQEDLTLSSLLKNIEVPNRSHTQLPPALPPYFYTIDGDRRARMTMEVETRPALGERIKYGWLPLFTPPPKPVWIPDEAFGPAMGQMVERRIGELVQAIKTIRARGGKVVLVRMPSTDKLRVLEERITPREIFWERILRESGAPGIWFEDIPELASFTCPEWSHLSAVDSVTFTRRLVGHLRQRLDLANSGR